MKIQLIILFVLHFFIGKTANIVEVIPLRNDVLMIHLDEGYVSHHKQGEFRNTESVIATPLNLELAMDLQSYSLSSSLDNNYFESKTPLDIHRKSKATDFAFLCQGWNNGCVNTDLDHAKEHWIYLYMPYALKNGSTYEMDLSSIDPSYGEYSFEFNDRQTRSEAVHVNMIGYVPSAPEKFGYVYHWMGSGGSMSFDELENSAFYLIEESSQNVAFEGVISFRKSRTNQEFAYLDQSPNGNLIGAEAWECDFSEFTKEGSYRLCVSGVGCSFPFEVSSDVFYQPWEFVQNGLYQHRSGIVLEEPYTDMPRPAPHNPVLTPGFDGKLVYTSLRLSDLSDGDAAPIDKEAIDAAIEGPLDVAGWYQDAGDWDAYFRHTEVPHTLLWLYEMHPNKFTDGQLNLPENENGVPDILDEALWLPKFMYRLREEMKTKGYGSGGVGGSRIFGDLWGDDYTEDDRLRGSWEDVDRQWVVTAEDPYMTYQYAALAAQIAVIYERHGYSDDIVDWKNECISAYNVGRSITRETDENMFGEELYKIRMHASAELYRITKEEEYFNQFIADYGSFGNEELSGNVVFALSAMVDALGHVSEHTELKDELIQKIYDAASFELSYSRDDRACRWGGNYWFPMLVGQGTTPNIIHGVFGHFLARKNNNLERLEEYEGALYSTADYFLGNNPLNTTWITRLGERSPREIFNLDSWVLGEDTPRRGLIPYGPWRNDGGVGELGPWNHQWANKFVYPENIDEWPGHERYFEQRHSPLASEYTINQNISRAILTYGYLYAYTAPTITTNTKIETIENSNLHISPNPAISAVNLNIEADEVCQYELIDSNGRVVKRGKYSKQIDVRELIPGFYHIRLYNADNERKGIGNFVKVD